MEFYLIGYEKILFGEDRPWLYYEIPGFDPNESVTSYVAKETIEQKKKFLFNTSVEDYFDFEMPPPFNDKTNYYQSRIKRSCKFQIEYLYDAINNSPSKEESVYFINNYYRILVLHFEEAHNIIKKSTATDNYTIDVETSQQEIHKKTSHFIVSMIKKAILFQLNHLKKYYPDLIGNLLLSEDGIYQKILNEESPSQKVKRIDLSKITKEKEIIVSPTIHSRITQNNDNSITQNKNLNIFIADLEYNYLLKNTVLSYYHQWKQDLIELKREVFANLITLNIEARKIYLQKIKLEFETLIPFIWSNQESVDAWLTKYQKTLDEVLKQSKDNYLFTILSKEKISFLESQGPDSNKDIITIQNDFYNYFYGYFINEALVFVGDQMNELNPNFIAPQKEKEYPRLKTNLSVPQLALLFKMLNDLKPNIFEVKSEAELHRFISANFETKKSKEEGISTDKLRILFNQPDSKAADFWDKHFYTLISEIKKIK